MYSLILSDIFTTPAGASHCFILGDVAYGACCIDDLSATALGSDFLIHYGHSCLIPIDATKIPCLYVFVDIKIDVDQLVNIVNVNFGGARNVKNIVLAGTVQFASAIRAAKSPLESHGFMVLIPQSKPFSAGKILGLYSSKG